MIGNRFGQFDEAGSIVQPLQEIFPFFHPVISLYLNP
jgi:hypothetical protein